MEPRYVETKHGLSIVWGGLGLVFGTGVSLVIGESLSDALLFGLAMGIGFAIAVILFFQRGE